MRLPVALPPLTGPWLAAYRLLWSLIFLAALAGATLGSWKNYQASAVDPSLYRLGLRGAPAGPQMLRIAPTTDYARAAGVLPGDQLMAVNGVPTETTLYSGRASEQLDGPDGSQVTLRLRGASGPDREVVLTRSDQRLREADALAPLPFAARNVLYTAINWLAKVACMLVAWLLFRRRASDPVAALLSLGLLSLSASFGAIMIEDPTLSRLLRDALSNFGSVCVLLGLAVFPSGRFEPRASLLVPALLVVGLPLRLLFPGTPAQNLLTPVLIAVLVGVLFVRFRRTPAGPQRQQIKALVFGVVVCVLMFIVSDALREWIGRTEDSSRFFWMVLGWRLAAAVGIIALCVSLLISLLRYRLYDADVVISRSAAYAGLTLAMVGIFAASEKLLEVLGEQYFSGSVGAFSGALAAAVAAAMFTPVHRRLDAWAERNFQQQLTELRRRLPLVVGDLRESATMAQLGEAVLVRVEAGVLATRSAFVVAEGADRMLVASRGELPADPSAWLARWSPPGEQAALLTDATDSMFPVRVPLVTEGAALAGWLLLGPRPDGSLYGRDEREVLLEIAEPVARAVLIVRRNEAWKSALDARLVSVESALARLGLAAPGG